MAEILDGPPEWAGTQFESPEEDLAPEIGLTHPRWRGTPVGIRWGALYAYRKVEVAGDRHGYRYQGPWGALVVRLGRLYSAPPATPSPDPVAAPEQQGWAELAEGDSSYPGCSTSRCTSYVSARVVPRSDCRNPAAKAGSGRLDPTGSHAECQRSDERDRSWPHARVGARLGVRVQCSSHWPAWS
jgi:hypothetical protein